MSDAVTKIKCSRCEGTGVDTIVDVVNNPSGVCQVCSGTGFVEAEYTDFTFITDALTNLKNDIKAVKKDTNDILQIVRQL